MYYFAPFDVVLNDLIFQVPLMFATFVAFLNRSLRNQRVWLEWSVSRKVRCRFPILEFMGKIFYSM